MNKPRLLSDNGSSYVAGELAEWLGDKNKEHISGQRIICKHKAK
jgi:putative transposase